MCKPAYREIATDLAMDLFQEAREKGYIDEVLAEKIGCSHYSILDYRYGRSLPSLAVFLGGWLAVKPEKPLKKLASWSGYVAVKLPDPQDVNLQLLYKKTAVSLNELAQFLEKSSNLFFKTKLTKAEAQILQEQGIKVIEKIIEVVKTAEMMAKE